MCSPVLVGVVSGQQGEEVAAGQANRGDWDPPRPLLHGTHTEVDSSLEPRLIGSITKEAGGTNLSPAIHPMTGSITNVVAIKTGNIVMWTNGSWFPFYQNTAA